MKLEKAIEILSQWDKGTDPLYLPDLPDAVKLGIEAMKYVYSQYDPDHQMMRQLLHGETQN